MSPEFLSTFPVPLPLAHGARCAQLSRGQPYRSVPPAPLRLQNGAKVLSIRLPGHPAPACLRAPTPTPPLHLLAKQDTCSLLPRNGLRPLPHFKQVFRDRLISVRTLLLHLCLWHTPRALGSDHRACPGHHSTLLCVGYRPVGRGRHRLPRRVAAKPLLADGGLSGSNPALLLSTPAGQQQCGRRVTPPRCRWLLTAASWACAAAVRQVPG